MKIAVWHNLPSGGGKRALHEQVAGLVKRGHQVEAWCPATADPDYLPLARLVPEHRLPFRVPPALSTRGRLLHALSGRENPLLTEMDRHSRECAEAILQGNFDVVFLAPCVFFRVPRLGRFLRGRGVPLVLYLQEPRREFYEARPELLWIAPKPGTFRQLPFFRRARARVADFRRISYLRVAARTELEDAKCYDRILVNSFYSREGLVRVYGLDARVCYLGYDEALFRRLDPPPPRENFAVGLGSFDHIKGHETAIRALGRLPEPRPALVWVANHGDTAYEQQMLALARQLGVDLQVRWLVQDKELVELLNRARLLLYTSHLEPFGYAPVEAGACGLPVVGVAEGGIRETVLDGVNGLLCDRDPDELARAIRRLDDPHLSVAMGEAGARLAQEKWAPEKSIDRLEKHLYAVSAAASPQA